MITRSLTLLLGLVACDGGKETGTTDTGSAGTSWEETMSLAAHRVPCVGEATQLCLVRDGAYFYDSVDGFSFQWGTASVLTVAVSEVAEPPEDGSAYRYSLVSVDESTDAAPGETFSWSLDGALAQQGYTPHLDLEAGELMDGTAFVCGDEAACTVVAQALEEGTVVSVTFAFADPITDPLVLVSAE